MIRVLALISVGVLSACSSGTPNTKLIVEEEMNIMDRQEVINAIEDCKSVNLRPVMFYGRRKINGQMIPVVVDITCGPKSGV
jgi:hypothetical protein|tara:strand:+ start:4670 stop:4915 length:246 start_codon:yes stop_codon:yes gene_type:complete